MAASGLPSWSRRLTTYLNYHQCPTFQPRLPTRELLRTFCDLITQGLPLTPPRSRNRTDFICHLHSLFLLTSNHKWSMIPFAMNTTTVILHLLRFLYRILTATPFLQSMKVLPAQPRIVHPTSLAVQHAAHQAPASQASREEVKIQ